MRIVQIIAFQEDSHHFYNLNIHFLPYSCREKSGFWLLLPLNPNKIDNLAFVVLKK